MWYLDNNLVPRFVPLHELNRLGEMFYSWLIAASVAKTAEMMIDNARNRQH